MSYISKWQAAMFPVVLRKTATSAKEEHGLAGRNYKDNDFFHRRFFFSPQEKLFILTYALNKKIAVQSQNGTHPGFLCLLTKNMQFFIGMSGSVSISSPQHLI